MKNEPWILSTDSPGHSSPEPGNVECVCSRCNKPIDENTIPIRAWPLDHRYELRYHPHCLGITVMPPPDP